jgi:hypothetical protein
MLKFDGKITQAELEAKIKSMQTKGLRPNRKEINEILEVTEDDGVNYDESV